MTFMLLQMFKGILNHLSVTFSIRYENVFHPESFGIKTIISKYKPLCKNWEKFTNRENPYAKINKENASEIFKPDNRRKLL